MFKKPTIEHLAWDSEFFDLRIGKVIINTLEDWEYVQSIVKSVHGSYDLLYIFSKADNSITIERAKLVDSKIVYSKSLTNVADSVNTHIREYQQSKPDAELYNLALISGQFSRYKLDPIFPAGSYERLYRKWIENSVNGQMADIVLIYSDGGHKLGTITIQIKDDIGSIGLLAVDVQSQGKGVGSALIQAGESWLKNNGVTSVEVSTQKDNRPACSFYEKCGFSQRSSTDIYHLWL